MIFKGLFQANSYVGISIGKYKICDAHILRGNRLPQLLNTIEKCSATSFFNGNSYTELQDILNETLAELDGVVKRKFIPIQIALPDPLISMFVFELDEIPNSKKAQQELISWRMAKSYYRDRDSTHCVSQYLGKQEDHHLMLGLAVDKDILECIRTVFKENKMYITIIDMAACHRFNYLRHSVALDSGVLISLDDDYWTLMIWDAQGRLRHVRSRWVEQPKYWCQEKAQINIMTEVKRAVRAYINEGIGSTIGGLYVSCNGEISGLCTLLEQDMHDTCRVLSTDVDLSSTGAHTPSLTTLSTALCQSR